MDFKKLGLSSQLLKAVADAGYTEPSPIQEQAIPPVLAGRDLLGCAQTGTGKTAAFALPILQLLAGRKAQGKGVRALILTPTRELALQIFENLEVYGKYLPLHSAVIFGGVGQQPQVDKLRRGVDILVATPGRLNDLIGQGYVKLDKLEIFVLDEADRMLDMGFVNDVKRVIRLLPEKRQTLLFSATIPDEIAKLADSLLYKPAKVYVTPPSTTVEAIEQSLYKVDKPNKRRLLAKLLADKSIVSALVFTRTKHGADRVARDLNRAGITAMAIHGDKSQGARQQALARFKKGEIRALVATDIAARGLDISELSHVINFDLPNIPETYVHRIGRTGRAGHAGIAISFCCFDELECLTDIEKLIGFKVPEVESHEWPMEMLEPHKPVQNNGRQKESRAPGEKKMPQKPEKEKQDKNKNGKKADKRPEKQIKKQAEKQPQKPAQPAAQAAPAQAKKGKGPKPARQKGRPLPPYDPYENLKGGSAIVTRKPVWATDQAVEEKAQAVAEGDGSMSRNNRRRGGKNRGKKPGASTGSKLDANKPKPPPIPKDENGLFNFSEAELSEDTSLQVISRRNSEQKYASFEDFLKDQ